MTERLVFLGQKAELTMLRLPDATLMVRLSGEWKLGRQLPHGEEFRRQIESAGTVSRITFDTQAVTGWDSGLITFLLDITEIGVKMHIHVEKDGLPAGVRCAGSTDRLPHQYPCRAHPGLYRRHSAQDFRCTDLRRQPRRDRDIFSSMEWV